MVLGHFTKATPYRLRDSDPPPFSLSQGNGSVIIASPHNGKNVPSTLTPYLGMEQDWFDSAHEASDIHIDRVYDHIRSLLPETSCIAGNYSRLVCDLNRKRSCAIEDRSTENRNTVIPSNNLELMSFREQNFRMEKIYDPYHAVLTELIQNTRERNGAAVMLEIHSFSPTWQGQKRDVELGTLHFENCALARTVADFIRQQTDMHFADGKPYNVTKSRTNVGRVISERTGIPYLGLEIRNDLIATPEGVERVSKLIQGLGEHLETHPCLKMIAHRSSQSKTMSQTVTTMNIEL